MATSSLPSFWSLTRSSYKPKLWRYPQVRSQSLHDEEGKETNKVDANLSVLRERIRDLEKKERLDMLENGWKYKLAAGYDSKNKSHVMLSESIAIVGLVSSSLCLVFLTGSFCIFLVSFVVQLCK